MKYPTTPLPINELPVSSANDSAKNPFVERDAAKVQALPVTNEGSRDVLDDLLSTMDLKGGRLIGPELSKELKQRVAMGVRKYGKRLQSFNDRDVKLDLRQEILDGIMYSHQGTMEGVRVAHIRNTLVKLLESLNDLEKSHW